MELREYARKETASFVERLVKAAEEMRAQIEARGAEQLTAAHAQTDAARKAFDDERKSLVAAAKKLTADLEAVRAKESALRQQIDKLRADSTAREREFEALSTTAAALREENEAVFAEDVALRQENDALRGDAAALREQIDGLRGDVAALQNKNDSLLAAEAALQQENEALRDDGAALREQNDGLRGDIAALHKKHDGLLAAEAALQQENEALRDDSAALRAQNVALSGDLAAVQKKHDGLLAAEAALRQDVEALRADLVALQKQHDELLAAEAALRQEHEAMRVEAVALRTQNDELRAAEATLRQENEALRDQATAMAEDRGTLLAEIDALCRSEDSASAVLTASLRALESLGTATDVSTLFAALVKATAGELSRVALFRVKENRLEGEHVAGPVDAANIKKLVIPMSVDSLMTRAVARGGIETAEGDELAQTRSPFGATPTSALAAPIVLGDETVTLLYAESDRPAKPAHVTFVQLLVRHTEVLLSQLSRELKTMKELREYATMLLQEAEQMFLADLAGNSRDEDRIRRLQDAIECGRQLYAQRAELEGSTYAGLFDEQIAEATRTSDSRFAAALQAATVRPAAQRTAS